VSADAGGGDADDAGADGADDGSGSFGDAEFVAKGPGCSGDLRSILDVNGNVVQTCAVDQGCASCTNGPAGCFTCVAACDAAAQSHGSLGCDFIIPTPAAPTGAIGSSPPCFAFVLTNNWPKNAQLVVERAGKTYDPTKFVRIPDPAVGPGQWALLAQGGVAAPGGDPPTNAVVAFLSDTPGNGTGVAYSSQCGDAVNPVPTAMGAPVALQGTARGAAWHVKTDVPVNIYESYPFFAPASGPSNLGVQGLRALADGTIVWPTTAWGTNYVGVLPPFRYPDGASGTQTEQWAQIVAAADGTTVTLSPTVDLPAGPNVLPAPKHTASTYTLNAGELLQFGPILDLTGTVIASDHPVGFTGGTLFLDATTATSSGSESGGAWAYDEIPPVNALGDEYVAAPFATRRQDLQPESIPYRIVSIAGGTHLTYDPPVPGAPTSLSALQVVDFETTAAFRVSSQDVEHPFYLAQMMSSCSVQSGSRCGGSGGLGSVACLGNTQFAGLLPPPQFLSSYTFVTDPSFTTSTVTVVRPKTDTGFADVNIDCIGAVKGWTDVGTGGLYQYANVDLFRVEDGVACIATSCDNGIHAASSVAPFGLMVWSEATSAAFGYPAAGNARSINPVSVPPK
jgi:hypothetical protein